MSGESAGMPELECYDAGNSLLVCIGGANPEGWDVARALPREPNRLGVVMSPAPMEHMQELAEILRPWIPDKYESVRLVAPFAGYSAAGAPSAAQELADWLGAEVLAPGAPVVGVPDGSLFVVGDDRVERSSWWRMRPGRPAEAIGRRFPSPEWERHLGDFADPAISGLVVEEIPAGIWIRQAGPVAKNDLAFAIPAHAT